LQVHLVNFKLFRVALLLAVLLLPFRSQAYDMYLSITGVSGEATNSLIAINSFQWGVGVAVSSPTGGTRSISKPSFSELTVTKVLDSASPSLIYFCASGSMRSSVVLTVKNPVTGHALQTITMGNVYISGVSSSSGGDRPSESLSLNYETIQWVYQQLDSNGNPVGTPITHSWNVATNTGT
jgi:type VI secretion system secreted protein Hcp